MINLISKIDAVDALYGRDSYYNCRGNGLVTWKDGHETTDAETAAINVKYDELLAEYDSQEYARNRQAEYPSINDLIVALWENVVEERAASVISLEATRQEIKAKYPK